MKKLTFEFVRQQFAAVGCELLEATYVGANSKMRYKCSCGNISSIAYSNFCRGKRCADCGGRKKLTFEYVKEQFAIAGCELLEKSYANAKSLMQYRCKCGSMSAITWDEFRKSKQCAKCSKKKKPTLEEVRNIFAGEGCVLLEKAYVNNREKMRYLCSCGRESAINLDNFQRGRRCQKCRIEGMTGPGHHLWIADREEVKKNQLFVRKCHSLLHRCRKCVSVRMGGAFVTLLGYGPRELRLHIYNHPSWANVSNKSWHLDHIFPVKAFLKHGIKDIKLINCLENLQPIEATTNLKKNAKYDRQAFVEWLGKKGINLST